MNIKELVGKEIAAAKAEANKGVTLSDFIGTKLLDEAPMGVHEAIVTKILNDSSDSQRFVMEVTVDGKAYKMSSIIGKSEASCLFFIEHVFGALLRQVESEHTTYDPAFATDLLDQQIVYARILNNGFSNYIYEPARISRIIKEAALNLK